jgi:Uma2 family endonuclease
MIDPGPGPISLEDYDALQPPEGEVYELYDGYVLAFSTGTGAHGILCTRIATALDSHVQAPCHVFGPSTIGVRRTDRATNVFPDGAVTCDDVDLSKTFIVAPKLVVEVISPTSLKRDRIDKLDIYRAIPSVHEYLMVDSRKVWASLYRRGPADTWIDMLYTGLASEIDLLSVDLKLSMQQLYRGINLSKKSTQREP